MEVMSRLGGMSAGMFPGGEDPRAGRGERVYRPNMNISWNIPGNWGEKKQSTMPGAE